MISYAVLEFAYMPQLFYLSDQTIVINPQWHVVGIKVTQLSRSTATSLDLGMLQPSHINSLQVAQPSDSKIWITDRQPHQEKETHCEVRTM